MTNERRYEFTIGNHTAQAHDYTSDLIDEAYRRKGADNPTTHLERVREADSLCEAHYAIIGDFPAESVLSRLAWYIVFDEMTDSHPDKMTREEYPIMSEHQMEYRKEKEIIVQSFKGIPEMLYKKDEVLLVEKRHYLDDLFIKASLTERQRQAIDLVYFGDMTQESAGKALGINKSNISEYLRNGLTKIRRVMDGKNERELSYAE